MVRSRANVKHARSLDLKKYFQQFELARAVRRFYAYAHHGATYGLHTVPTGAVAPPIFAQILSRALALMATRDAAMSLNADAATVFTDMCIDDIRLS